MKIDQEVDYLEAFTGCQKQKMFRILDNQEIIINTNRRRFDNLIGYTKPLIDCASKKMS